MGRLINLDDAINAVSNLACSMSVCLSKEEATGMRNMRDRVVKVLNSLPTAQPSDDYNRGWEDGQNALREEQWENGRDRLD